jgi:hypothetical protein
MSDENKVVHAKSGKIAQIMERLEIIATRDLVDSPVLFTGETGTGKEMLADYLVEHIPNNSKGKLLYKKINCIGLPENLIESELFGHTKGAFTGAEKERTGLIEESEGGILFLDEIGVLSEQLQAKLLRVLEDREIRKVGSSESKKIDVRFIAATNGELIVDLKHRFSSKIEIPSLKDNPEEIPYLLDNFLRESPFQRITVGTLLAMAKAEWEGNIRELKYFLRDAEISAEVIKKKTAHGSSRLVSKEGFLDIVLLHHLSTGFGDLMEKYWTVRTFTTFDGRLSEEIPEAKKIKMDGSYRLTQLTSLIKTGLEYQSVLLRQDAPCKLEEEFYLELDESFPTTAEKLIQRYAIMLSDRTFETLDSVFKDPSKRGVSFQRGMAPSIEVNERFLKMLEFHESESEVPDIFNQAWKPAQKTFKGLYWKYVHDINPKAKKKQIAKIMGVSEQTYQNWKKEFEQCI